MNSNFYQMKFLIKLFIILLVIGCESTDNPESGYVKIVLNSNDIVDTIYVNDINKLRLDTYKLYEGHKRYLIM